MLQTFRNAWRIPELRKKILYTVLLLVIFRFGSVIPVPWINTLALQNWLDGSAGSTLFDLLDTFSGGAFSQATIFAMSISPYINSSIIMQLLCVAIPALERLSKEGEEGRKKITALTRYLTVVLAAVQAYGLFVTLHNKGAINYAQATGVPRFVVGLTIVLAFTAGTAFLMWLGEQITGRGIGNGISMLIFAGIVSSIPTMIHTAWVGFFPKQWWMLIFLVIYTLASIVFVILINEGERRIPVQYAKRVVGRKMYGGQSTNIPIKVVMGGVMPIIFASSIMAFPATIVRLLGSGEMPEPGEWGYTVLGMLSAGYGPWWTDIVYAVLYFLLIIFFTYFYASIQFNPIEMANNIKKNGGFIPAIRPGKPTSDYIFKVSNRLNLAGAIFLGIIAIIPVFFGRIFGMTSLQIGGTSLLIMEGVALETVKQIESQMVMRHYKGFME